MQLRVAISVCPACVSTRRAMTAPRNLRRSCTRCSWEDDAFVGDKLNARFVDTTKVHPIAHRGTYYSVAGPLNVPRSPQGRPVTVQAGGSSNGRDFAASHAEAVFTLAQTIDESVAYARDLR